MPISDVAPLLTRRLHFRLDLGTPDPLGSAGASPPPVCRGARGSHGHARSRARRLRRDAHRRRRQGAVPGRGVHEDPGLRSTTRSTVTPSRSARAPTSRASAPPARNALTIAHKSISIRGAGADLVAIQPKRNTPTGGRIAETTPDIRNGVGDIVSIIGHEGVPGDGEHLRRHGRRQRRLRRGRDRLPRRRRHGVALARHQHRDLRGQHRGRRSTAATAPTSRASASPRSPRAAARRRCTAPGAQHRAVADLALQPLRRPDRLGDERHAAADAVDGHQPGGPDRQPDRRPHAVHRLQHADAAARTCSAARARRPRTAAPRQLRGRRPDHHRPDLRAGRRARDRGLDRRRSPTTRSRPTSCTGPARRRTTRRRTTRTCRWARACA